MLRARYIFRWVGRCVRAVKCNGRNVTGMRRVRRDGKTQHRKRRNETRSLPENCTHRPFLLSIQFVCWIVHTTKPRNVGLSLTFIYRSSFHYVTLWQFPLCVKLFPCDFLNYTRPYYRDQFVTELGSRGKREMKRRNLLLRWRSIRPWLQPDSDSATITATTAQGIFNAQMPTKVTLNQRMTQGKYLVI